jgi:hypothetical protein
MIRIQYLLFCLAVGLALSSGATSQDIVSLAGGNGNQRFYGVMQLSDQTVLVAGVSDDLEWIDAGVPRVQLAADSNELINDNGTDKYPFLLHLSASLDTPLGLYHLPQGAAEEIRYIKTDTSFGVTTGNIYISGKNASSDSRSDGYYVAKLNNNFISGAPTAVEWAFTVWAEGDHEEWQPWDVDNLGRVIYVRGQANSTSWCALHRWEPATRANGVIPDFRFHWIGTNDSRSEFHGSAAEAPEPVLESGIVLKPINRGPLRSWNTDDFEGFFRDGNGGWRRGKYPADLFYSEPFDVSDPSGSQSLGGYTGYRLPSSGSTTARVGGLAVDKRNNHFYLGYNFKSVLPGGNPDFEPTVMAFTDTGAMKWWNRLWREYDGEPGSGSGNTSSPDQYVDSIAVDYSQPPADTSVVVLARSHGNNTTNFWSGNSVAEFPTNPSFSFHNRFTGNSGNIHISWLGRFGADDGILRYASWCAEYPNTTDRLGAAYTDPNLDGWPSHNAGWPDLNTTRMRPTMHVDLQGRIYVICKAARRTITTANAYQKMIKFGEGESKWNHYVRVFTSDLTTLEYSSLLTGDWDGTSAGDPNNVEIHGIYPVTNGLLSVGFHKLDNGSPSGAPIPQQNTVSWGRADRVGETPVIARLNFEEFNPPDGTLWILSGN